MRATTSTATIMGHLYLKPPDLVTANKKTIVSFELNLVKIQQSYLVHTFISQK